MRVLVIGKKQSMHWPENVAKFLPTAHERGLFLYNELTIQSIMDKFLRRNRWKNRAQVLRKQILKFKPDLIFFVSAFFIPEEFYDVAASFDNIMKVGWTGDAFGMEAKRRADVLDILFCSDTGFLKRAKNFSCVTSYLPLCADETTFYFQHKKLQTPPFFVGDANPVRIEWLTALKMHMEIWGVHWPRKKLYQHSIHNRRLNFKQVNCFYNTSVAPVNLNFSPNGIYGLNFRVFEVSAAGGLIIVNHQKDLSLCYDIGKECVVFHTPSELDALLRELALNPLKYQAIAENGTLRTLKEHTYTKRLAQAFKQIEAWMQKNGRLLKY